MREEHSIYEWYAFNFLFFETLVYKYSLKNIDETKSDQGLKIEKKEESIVI